MRKVAKLGEGTFGRVYNVETERGHAALKLFKEDEERFSYSLLREVGSLKYLAHPNVVSIHGICDEGAKSPIGILLELMDYSLMDRIHSDTTHISVDTVKNWMGQLLQGVAHFHANKMMHRDLKPANILLSNKDTVLKIGDLGATRTLPEPKRGMSAEVTTICYRAPEILTSNSAQYTEAVDMWAIGCIMYEMVTRNYCFPQRSEASLKLQHSDFKFQPLQQLGDQGNDLLQGLLCKDPAKRLTAKQALGHPWVGKATICTEVKTAATNVLRFPDAVNEQMRTILIDWLYEVSIDRSFAVSTIHLAVAYLDSALSSSCSSTMIINRSNLQLLGIVCLALATKMNEIKSITPSYAVYVCDDAYTRGDFEEMEAWVVTKALNWEMIRPTALDVARDMFKGIPDGLMTSKCDKCPSQRMHKWIRVVEALDFLLIEGWMLGHVDMAAVAICYVFGPLITKHLAKAHGPNNMDDIPKWRRMMPLLPHLEKNVCKSVLHLSCT